MIDLPRKALEVDEMREPASGAMKVVAVILGVAAMILAQVLWNTYGRSRHQAEAAASNPPAAAQPSQQQTAPQQ